MTTGELTASAVRPAAWQAWSRQRYIVSPLFDWVFFIGSPLLAVALINVATLWFSEANISGVVLTFMAIGHHVPTFLRAYADPDEFARNRYRLVVVPVLVVGVMALLAARSSQLLQLIFVWDQYHFVRQHYGFMRIYDAKNGVVARSGPNLDLWLCFSLFIYIIAKGDLYSYIYAYSLLDAGLPPPAWLGALLYQIAAVVAVAVVVLFALDLLRRVREGQPVSPFKIAITLTTYGVWYYAYVVYSNPFLSYSISSFFHCLQYDALAWHYNRRKAAALPEQARAGVFRYLHAGRHVWAYVLAIFAYGFLSTVFGAVAPAVVFVINRTTGVLHYYYDSFIWQVRSADFRKNLG